MRRLLIFASLSLSVLLVSADEHPYGGIRFTGTFEIDGVGTVTDYTLWAESYPTQYHVKAVLPEGACLYAYTVSDDPQGLRFPMMDESLWLMPPMESDAVMDVGTTLATAQLWVDPDAGDDDSGTGGELSPFETLVKAVGTASNKAKNYTVIHAAAGEYTNKTASADGQTAARVLVDRAVRIKGAGRGKSVIRGASDATDGDEFGCGPNAVRCIQFSTFEKACVQGFTLTDGRSDLSTSTAEKSKGGVVCKGADNHICDCELKDCIGYNTAASYGGTFVRTYAHDCVRTSSMTAFNANNASSLRLISCVVRGASSSGAAAVVNTATALQCTILGERNSPADSAGAYAIKQNSTVVTNCAVCQAGRQLLYYAGHIGGSVIWEVGYESPEYFTRDGNVKVSDPLIYKPTAGDCRPASVSPLLGAGLLSADYYRTYSPDVNGDPVLFIAGRPIAGAVQRTVQTLVVPKSAKYATLKVDGASSLTNAVDTGDVVTLTLADATRPGGSFVVNGETVAGPSYAYTAGPWDGVSVGTPFVISEVVFSKDWYVDANRGDDANTGFYPGAGHAKKTLQAAIDCLSSGDTLHAAAGTYSLGACTNATVGISRVYVSEGRTLLSDEGPEKTVILGADAPEETRGDWGLGEGAVRCAKVDNGGVLDGFTLTGGRTQAGTVSNVSANNGGGVYAAPRALVRNCIITNNVAGAYGGGLCHGTNVNCRILYNRAKTASAGSKPAALIGCVVDWNYGSSCFDECNWAYNCYFGANNRNAADTDTVWGLYYPASENAFVNCIVLCKYGTGDTRPFQAYNSVFANRSDSYTTRVVLRGNSVITNAADVVLDGHYAPASRDSFLVDAGDEENLQDRFGGKDVNGDQRVYNGMIDIGPAEFDWRSEYRADIAPSPGMEVAAASPEAYEAGTSVLIPDGSSVTVDWTRESAGKARIALDAEVTGTGTLSVFCNGKLVGTRTSADSGEFSFRVTDAVNRVVLAYSAGEDDTGFAVINGIAPSVKGLMLILR